MTRSEKYIERVDNELLYSDEQVRIFPASIRVIDESGDSPMIGAAKYSSFFGIAPLFYQVDEELSLQGCYMFGSKLVVCTQDVAISISGAGVDQVSHTWNSDIGLMYHLIQLSDPEEDITITFEEVI